MSKNWQKFVKITEYRKFTEYKAIIQSCFSLYNNEHLKLYIYIYKIKHVKSIYVIYIEGINY